MLPQDVFPQACLDVCPVAVAPTDPFVHVAGMDTNVPGDAVTEALQDCARMFLGNSILKPHVFTSELRLSSVKYG